VTTFIAGQKHKLADTPGSHLYFSFFAMSENDRCSSNPVTEKYAATPTGVNNVASKSIFFATGMAFVPDPTNLSRNLNQ